MGVCDKVSNWYIYILLNIKFWINCFELKLLGEKLPRLALIFEEYPGSAISKTLFQ